MELSSVLRLFWQILEPNRGCVGPKNCSHQQPQQDERRGYRRLAVSVWSGLVSQAELLSAGSVLNPGCRCQNWTEWRDTQLVSVE